ncbi:MAG: DNA replication/repair protein RecF [Clostridia bacterium]|nr:DNA replication/repair protein RecF [Clostridia bacterium]MBQ5770223.1 DNA replication/repair protein RecF [Clostridia bacterium]
MRITSIQLQGFRNYEKADIRPCDGITVFTGNNAQGKTNILEAVYLSCTGRSHRTVHDKEMINTGHDFARVRVEARRNDGMHDVEIALNQMGRRKIKVAGNAVSRSGEMLGHITGVLFAPEDLRMIKDGPAERRRFVDMELSQLRPKYYYALQRYARALKQRGVLLKEAAVNPSAVSMIDMFDEQLAESGALIMDMRRDFIRKLSAKAGEVHAHVSGGLEKLSVEYCPSIQSDAEGESLQSAICETLRRARSIDLKRMVTSIGPHRDDVRMNLNGMDARAYGSQGQVRTCALSMKLSELAIMTEESGESPVLMLDDVMSELDPGRRRMLLNMLSGVQTFVTCTDIDDLAGAECGKIIKVKSATLEEVMV